MKPIKLLIAMMLVLGLILGASGAFAKTTLVYGTTERVTDMDPANAYDFHTWEIFYNIYQGLMGYPAGKTNLVPQLAESYKVVDGGKGYIFKLREGLKFSDGTPFDAEAVKWSMDRVMKLKGDPSWLVTDFVKSVEVVSKYEVKFNLKNPVAYFPALVATVPYYPVNPNVYPADKIVTNPGELGRQAGGPGRLSGRLIQARPGNRAGRQPGFWGDKPKNDRVVIRYFADATTMRLALEKGELDFAFKSFNPSDISDLMNSNKIKTIIGQGPYIRYLCFQCAKHMTDKTCSPGHRRGHQPPRRSSRRSFWDRTSRFTPWCPWACGPTKTTSRSALGDGNIAKSQELLAKKGYNEAITS
jgi:peptide/nickel transport system substrate-binding protein